jgi:hypothetical protein
MCGQIGNKCDHWNGNKRFKEAFTSHAKRTFNRFPTKATLHIIFCIDNVMSCNSYFVQLIHIRSHITSHILTMWRNVTCIMSKTQTSHLISHDNVMQCDLYHVQLLQSRNITSHGNVIQYDLYHVQPTVTSHYITWQCDTMWLVSRPTPTVTSHYITWQCDAMWLVYMSNSYSHVTLHHITMWCNVTCITSNSYSHVTLHHMTMWYNVTYITSNLQSRHITSHDNVMQYDLYHVQLLQSRHITLYNNVTCMTSNLQSRHITSHDNVIQCDFIMSNSYTVTLHYITCLNNISSPATSTDLTCRWELFFTSILLNTTTIITSVSDKFSLINHMFWNVVMLRWLSISCSGQGALAVITLNNVLGLTVTSEQIR